MSETIELLRRLGLADDADHSWVRNAGGDPGRIAAMHGRQVEVMVVTHSGLEHRTLDLSRSLATTPVTGDWVVVDEERILSLGGRTTNLSRPDPSGHGVQVLAANIDHVMLVLPLEHGLNLKSLERLAVMAWDSGATPLTVLTKADTVADPTDALLQASLAAPGVEIILTSSVSGLGLERLREIMTGGTTTTMLGASGAGKTSLLNALEGRSEKVREVNASGEGRHATTWRRLYQMASGGVLLDLPGIRSLELIASDEGVDETFVEIARAAQRCRFRNCEHVNEPGCAVLADVANGEIPQRRLDNWRKIRREMAHQERKGDSVAMAEQRAQWKSMSKIRRAR